MSEHETDRDDEIVETAGDGRFVRFADKLGSGAFKTVFRGFDTERGIEVAWNQVLYERYNLDLSRVMNEIEVFKTIRNPHIIEFYHAWQDSDAKQVVFITELMPSGTLKQFTKKTPNVKLKVLKNWCMQILMGLDYLHSLQPPIIHRDIKCDNIFINGLSEGEVKIGDFGLATFSSREQGMSLAGTPEFMAPEFYSDQYSTAVDIWAFGMLVIEMVTHEFPYSECRGIHQICGKVTNGIMPTQLNRITHPALVDFITLCLTVETESRPTARALLSHPFFEEESDGDLEIGNLLAAADQDSLLVSDPVTEGVIVMDPPSETGVGAMQPMQPVPGGSGYLSPPGNPLVPPEATLLAPVEPTLQPVDLDGYLSHGPMYHPTPVSDVQPEYHSDVNHVATAIHPVPMQPFQPTDVAYLDTPNFASDSAYASDHANVSDAAYLSSDGAYLSADGAYASDSGYAGVVETFGGLGSDPIVEEQQKALVSAEVVYLNAVNAGDGQLGLRMNIVTSDGKEQHTDEVSFDFMLNSDTPASIAVEMLRLFNLKQSALPQLEATISERVFFLAQSLTEEMPVQLEPDFQNDALLVDSPKQPETVQLSPDGLPDEFTAVAPAPVAPVAPVAPFGFDLEDSELSLESSVEVIPNVIPEFPVPYASQTVPDHRAVKDTFTDVSSDNVRLVVGEQVRGDIGASWAGNGGAIPALDQSAATLQAGITEQQPVFGIGLADSTVLASETILSTEVFEDEDTVDSSGNSGQFPMAFDSPLIVTNSQSSSSHSLIVVSDGELDSGLEDVHGELMDVSTSSAHEDGSRSATSQPSPALIRRERSRPRSHTSPMLVPMLNSQGSSPMRSPGLPSVFASPFPDSNRYFGRHMRRESSDLNSSFKFVLPPEEDDIEELESYLDNESSPVKDCASSPTRGSISDYASLQNFDTISTCSTTASLAPRSTAAECSNSDMDTYEYFTDDAAPDSGNIFIDGFADGEEEEEEEEDKEMMQLRAKQQLELQRLIHAHERELAAAKQSRRETRLRRAAAMKKQNAHILASDLSSMLSDEEGYRRSAIASGLNRSFSVPPEELLQLDCSSESESVG